MPSPRVRNPGCGADATDAEIRRRTLAEASTARGHHWFARAHDNMAAFCREQGYGAWASYHTRMADAHDAMAHSLDALSARKVPNPRKRVVSTRCPRLSTS